MDFPEINDYLFKKDDESPWQMTACLSSTLPDWERYYHSYKSAADLLVEKCKEQRGFLDRLIYPICFLYRQHIEIILKLIELYVRKINYEKGFTITHSLEKLWSNINHSLEDYTVDFPKGAIEAIESLILEFHEIDPTSYAFRYPANKKWKHTLPNMTHINVYTLKSSIDKLSSTLLLILERVSYDFECRYNSR